MFKSKRKSKYELDAKDLDCEYKIKKSNIDMNGTYDDSNNLIDDINTTECVDDSGGVDSDVVENRNSRVGDCISKHKTVSSLLISLPGATARRQESNKINGTPQGETPSNVVRNIRSYLDILFASVLLEAQYVLQNCETGGTINRVNMSTNENNFSQINKSSIAAVPGVVSAILAYNNIEFKTIALAKTTIDIFEPIWYTYNVRQSRLTLFINEFMYDEFCIKNGDSRVLFTNGIVPIEQYNPYESNKHVPSINLAIVHCAILCDHVAQHILDDLLVPRDDVTARCVDLHDSFGKHGTTLHSMFHLENIRIPTPRVQTTQNYNINAMMMLNLDNYPENGRSTLPSFLNNVY